MRFMSGNILVIHCSLVLHIRSTRAIAMSQNLTIYLQEYHGTYVEVMTSLYIPLSSYITMTYLNMIYLSTSTFTQI
jgi:hypothetical protein